METNIDSVILTKEKEVVNMSQDNVSPKQNTDNVLINEELKTNTDTETADIEMDQLKSIGNCDTIENLLMVSENCSEMKNDNVVTQEKNTVENEKYDTNKSETQKINNHNLEPTVDSNSASEILSEENNSKSSLISKSNYLNASNLSLKNNDSDCNSVLKENEITNLKLIEDDSNSKNNSELVNSILHSNKETTHIINKDANSIGRSNNSTEKILNDLNAPLDNNELDTEITNSVSSHKNSCKDNLIENNSMDIDNTEFVQYLQDKNDDIQLENQSADAEDPFGTNSINSNNLENSFITETNELSKMIESRNSISYDDSNIKITEYNNDDHIERISNIQKIMEIDKDKSNTHINTKNSVSNEINEESQGDDETMKLLSNDTNVEQTDVLPGQDDELCIIPDSMKLFDEKSQDKDNFYQDSNFVDKNTVKKVENENRISNQKELVNKNSVLELNKSQKKDATSKNSCTATDVINIDDEIKNEEVKEIVKEQTCKQCGQNKICSIKVKVGTESYNVCSKICKTKFKTDNNKATDIPNDGVNSKKEKRCANCLLIIETNNERNLSWETMEFCNEECLGKFQTKYGSYCRNCNGAVQAVSLGKYCVRFGYDVRQFCCSTCLEEFKKGLKVCSYCQKDISSTIEGFLAPVGDKGQFKDFCTQDCMEKYTKMNSSEPSVSEKKKCSVCQQEKVVHCEVEIKKNNPIVICSEPCFAAFKFVNKVDPDQCSMCKKFFESPNKKNFVVFYDNEAHTFCTKTCLNVFIIANRKILSCNWCKVKKYNFDMIKKELKTGQTIMMCSLNCLTLYQVSISAVSAKRIRCDNCKEFSQAQYHLTMSDATIRNFCSYNCVMNFQSQYTKSPITIPPGDDPVPTGMPKRTGIGQRIVNEQHSNKTMPIISSVTSLASVNNGQTSIAPQTSNNVVSNIVVSDTSNKTAKVFYKQQVITKPASPVKIHNKIIQCKPLMHTKGVSVRPHPCTKSTQTEGDQPAVIPIPVPIYVPYPMHMYSMPFPVPVPIPLPIPVPIFIPTTRNSAKGIFKDIKRIQEKIPADPFEAELLMMAEMVATEKKTNDSDSDSVDENTEPVDSNNTFGDDMLQMALKMATGELDESAVDLEATLPPNTITASQAPAQTEQTVENNVTSRGRKRIAQYKSRATLNKRSKRGSNMNDMPLMPPPEPHPPPQSRILDPMERPDANMALKWTFGVNAWRLWVIGKNAELEKLNTPTKKVKLFKTDLLQLTADELNYSLCLFVKEVKKPNNVEYAPDTLYYLCLGIQQYLFENNRIDNIFTDSYYEKFTDCLNEVAKKFAMLYSDAQYIITRVEEEHLWECKQLGAHSPHVLLNTLMYFNTKHFNLVTVEEHMQLSFSHIMKHWKRNPAAQPATIASKSPGSRNVLLRFYPPQSALEGNSRKKKVYEQQENEENPLRCPVKLYEFYLSKCPESVKTRNDVFYLLPERSCVPDSPVWYSTSPLAKEQLTKMLYRLKMVKEINEALLTT